MKHIFILFLFLSTNVMAQTSFHDLSFTTIEGSTISFGEFEGRKVLIVNTASKCGYTPQYAQLEELHEEFSDRLVVVGFPSNDFGKQEPGSNEEIVEFCQKNYGVSFLMSEKISVTGKDDEQHPVYTWLSRKELNGVSDNEVRWNFHKFLVDEQGQLIKMFSSKVSPLDEEIIGLIEQ